MDPRDELKEQLEEAIHYIGLRTSIVPEVGIVLGSGLGAVADGLQDAVSIPYRDLPYFPTPMAPGHPGNLVLGQLGGKNAVVMQGRFHFYEGYTMRGITFPIRVMQALGAGVLVVTNAAGGLSQAFEAGDMMAITDHINLMGDNPLVGPNDDTLGPRFLGMTDAYDPHLLALAMECGKACGTILRMGVYAGVVGPSYETAAELKALSQLGADVVGMSTVPEVIVARHGGMKVLGISCIGNICGDGGRLTGEDVLATASRTAGPLCALLEKVAERL